MSETAVAFAELLEPDSEIDSSSSYLLGQLAAELVASDPGSADLGHLIAATQHAHQESVKAPGAEHSSRALVCRFILGLFQGALVERRSAASKRAAPSLTVRQRALNLLALAPQNPSSLSKEIGCNFATASRALTRLQEQGLAAHVAASEQADGRHRQYELTKAGEAYLDDHFLGRVEETRDEAGIIDNSVQDHGDALASLTKAVADLNKHDPALAANLHLGLEALKDEVSDPDLRADALGELSILSRIKPDLVLADRSRGWVDELIALSEHGSLLTAARAHYERARWMMRYQNSNNSCIESDLEIAEKYAVEAGGPDGNHRTAWCLHQRSNRALWRRDWKCAVKLADSASADFARLNDLHGLLASQLVSARAKLASGDVSSSRDELAWIVETAQGGNYKRQLADGLFWLGQAEVWNDEADANTTINAAAKLYDELGDHDWRALAEASAETAVFIAGDLDPAAAKALRRKLTKAQREIAKSKGDELSPAVSFKLASIYRRIAVLSAFAGDQPQANRAWKRAVDDFAQSESPRGVSVTLASYWLAKTGSDSHCDEVPSDDEVREIGRHLRADPSVEVIECARVEVDRVVRQQGLDRRSYFKHELAYC